MNQPGGQQQQPPPLNLGKISVWPPKETEAANLTDENKICLDKTLSVDMSNLNLNQH
jgi:hypothetical protein